MFKQISTQATAFGLAALVTLATLASVNALARSENGNELARIDSTPVQQVVVIGQRAARS